MKIMLPWTRRLYFVLITSAVFLYLYAEIHLYLFIAYAQASFYLTVLIFIAICNKLFEMQEVENRTRKNQYSLLKQQNFAEKMVRSRNHQVAHVCRLLGKEMKRGDIRVNSWDELLIDQKPRLYFSDKYKVVVCGVPKSGSTEWRKALLILEGDVNVTSPDDIQHEEAFTLAQEKRSIWRSFNSSTKKGLDEIEKRLNTYYRLMTVREPLERLVSAYLDKMVEGGTAVEYYKYMSKEIHRRFGKNGETGSDFASFSEFIASIQNTTSKAHLDIHWRPFSSICDPCIMKYHHIAKLETITLDSQHVTDHLGIDSNLLFPGKFVNDEKKVAWEARNTEYFRKLPVSQAIAMYQYYRLEYHLFGYPPPSFLPT